MMPSCRQLARQHRLPSSALPRPARRRPHRAHAGVQQGVSGDGAAAAGRGLGPKRQGCLWRHRHVSTGVVGHCGCPLGGGLCRRRVSPAGALSKPPLCLLRCEHVLLPARLWCSWEAAKGGQDDCLELLLRRGGRLGRAGVDEASLLCQCVFSGELALLRRLLRAGAHPDAGDYDQRTALHIAAAESNLPAAEQLVTGGADPGVRDRCADGGMCAAGAHPFSCLLQVVRPSAPCCRCPCRWGHTPLDEARRVGAAAVCTYLGSAQAARQRDQAAVRAATAAPASPTT